MALKNTKSKEHKEAAHLAALVLHQAAAAAVLRAPTAQLRHAVACIRKGQRRSRRSPPGGPRPEPPGGGGGGGGAENIGNTA